MKEFKMSSPGGSPLTQIRIVKSHSLVKTLFICYCSGILESKNMDLEMAFLCIKITKNLQNPL